MPRLLFQITDRDGEVLSTLAQDLAGNVEIPLNDARLASRTLSLYDPASAEVRPLARMLKVFWGDWLVFWGPILQPSATSDEAAGNAQWEVGAHDPSLAWKKNYQRFGDASVEEGYRIDGVGMWTVAEAAIPSFSQRSRGVPHPGWLQGVDDSVAQTPKPDKIDDPDPGDGLWARAKRGDQVWKTIEDITSSVIGPDYNLRPIDADHPGVIRTWLPGFFCEWNVYAERGVDRSVGTDAVVFTRGFGTDNCSQATYAPDGDAVVNYAVAVPPGGEKDRHDTKKALVHDEDSWQEIGIYESWLAEGSDSVSQRYLELVAQQTVQSYTTPPEGITLTLRDSAPRYLEQFTEGDLVRVIIKQGYLYRNVVARVMKVTLQDDGKAGKTMVDVVPRVSVTFDAEDPGV